MKHYVVCTVDGCEQSHHAHGFCSKHYQRWKTHGTAELVHMERSVWFQRGDGRWLVCTRGGGAYLWYRILMWNEIGRELTANEIVHHANNDPSDDRIENLRIVPGHAPHAQLHHREGTAHSLTDADRQRARAVRYNSVTLTRPTCGDRFERAPSQVQRATVSTCSAKCRATARSRSNPAEASGAGLRGTA